MATDIYTARFQGKVSTQNDPLTIRESASTSAPVVGRLERGSTNHRFAAWYPNGSSSSTAAWLLAYPNGQSGAAAGLVSAQYITWLPSYSHDGGFVDYITVASGEYVNLRKTPSKSASVIGKLHNNDAILVLRGFNTPNSGWTHVATAQGTGWVMTSYIAGKG